MTTTLKCRVKICCISSVSEARRAIAAGASALGFVSAMPSGPGIISEDAIAEIVRTVPPLIGTFLLTSKQDAASIIKQHQQCRTNTIQLTDCVDIETYRELRHTLVGISLVQVIHVTDEASLAEAVQLAPFVDALLLDSGNPMLAVKELGGTGRTHNWSISRRIRDSVSVPIFLAGGLNATNVQEAVETVKPFGVDLCSGVRTGGNLDDEKLNEFFHSLYLAK